MNHYAATKQAFEALLAFYAETAALRAVTLRLFDTYGPGGRRQKLFRLLATCAREGTELAMSAREQLLDVVYIDDVVQALLLAAQRVLSAQAPAHEIYAVGSGQPRPLREVVEQYGRACGRPLRVQWGARPYRPREVMVPWAAGRPVPGWRPRVGLEEGLRRMLAEVPP